MRTSSLINSLGESTCSSTSVQIILSMVAVSMGSALPSLSSVLYLVLGSASRRRSVVATLSGLISTAITLNA